MAVGTIISPGVLPPRTKEQDGFRTPPKGLTTDRSGFATFVFAFRPVKYVSAGVAILEKS